MEIFTLGLASFVMLAVLSVINFLLFRQLSQARAQMVPLAEARAVAESKRAGLEAELETTRMAQEKLRDEKENAQTAKIEAEKREALAQSRIETLQTAMQDFEAQREKMSLAAHEAVVKVGSELSNKLLADHKREAEAGCKEQEERTQKVTQSLMEQFLKVTQEVGTLQAQGKASAAKTDTLYRALSTPGGAGQHAEIGLENSLKNLGLEAGRDYFVQYNATSDEGGRLRPDAVVFLPHGRVLAVDSKASKHLLAFAEAEDDSGRAAASENLKRSMNTHLTALASKDYSSAIEARYREAGRSGEIAQVFNVMCLQNEAAFEHLRRADPEFAAKAERKGLILTNPAGLSAMFSIAKMHLNQERQAENQERIIEQVKRLVDSMHVVIDHAGKVGRGLKSAADGFADFSRSVNRTLIPRIAMLDKMGVGSPKNKGVPKPLAAYYITQADEVLTLEMESDEPVTLELLVNKSEI